MDGSAVAELLDDRPELADALSDLLAVDEETTGWTYDDVPVDSGAFGELVSRNIVEHVDDGDGYRLADPDAVRAAIENDGPSSPDSGSTDKAAVQLPTLQTNLQLPIRTRLSSFDRVTAGGLAGAFALVVAFRAFIADRVFRGDAVVLTGNDPYYYRYWVEQALSNGALPPILPAGIANGEPLFVATLSVGSLLLGGSTTATGWVLAWYPVVAALAVAACVYYIATGLTADRRVGIAAVVMLAVVPAHANRTSLGFADHHAFDYVWLAVTMSALVALAGRQHLDSESGEMLDVVRTRDVTLPALVLGVGVAGQALAWEASPLLLFGSMLYVGLLAPSLLLRGRAPELRLAPLLGGFGLASVLTLAAWQLLGWAGGVVALVPVLLLLGSTAVAGLGALFDRQGWSVRGLLAAEVLSGLLGVAVVRVALPSAWAVLVSRGQFLIAPQGILETGSLFSGSWAAWLFLFGLLLVFTIPLIAWALYHGLSQDAGWLVIGTYGIYLLGLSTLQNRFAGHLAVPLSILAGLGFVWLVSKVDIGAPVAPLQDSVGNTDGLRALSLPSSRSVVAVGLMFLLVSGLSAGQTLIIIDKKAIGDSPWETAEWIDDYADSEGLEYPQNYVFSVWWKTRLYNHFVNGEANSYGFAQGNYQEFIASTKGEVWYQKLTPNVSESRNSSGAFVGNGTDARDSPGPFIVLRNATGGTDRMLQHRLYVHYGSRTEKTTALAHYQFLNQEGPKKTYLVVPGATLLGEIAANERVTVEANVTVDGTQFVYERQTQAGGNGRFAVTVPYPGQYRIRANGTEMSVTVSDEAVDTGANVTAGVAG